MHLQTLLGGALASCLLNLSFVEPKATDLMFKRYALENAEGPRDDAKIKALYGKFGMWHGISSMLNLGALGCACAHLWWLAVKCGF